MRTLHEVYDDMAKCHEEKDYSKMGDLLDEQREILSELEDQLCQEGELGYEILESLVCREEEEE